jgi:RES domain
MVELDKLPPVPLQRQEAYRLISSKFPPIAIFDDVASNEEFEALYRVQSRTNPRLLDAVGEIHRVPRHRRPFGIPGCNYALAPFVHINMEGSRFSQGEFGVLYAAEQMPTAIAETRYHQERYLQQQLNSRLKYDRLVMRGLKLVFSASLLNIYKPRVDQHGWYDPEDYSAARELGAAVKAADKDGILYASVRLDGEPCYALFAPDLVHSVIQTTHYEYLWDGSRISAAIELKDLR